MSYLVMARKYRPRNFEEVVGQPQVVRTLTNALKRGRFAHAYIFYGPRGVGKTTVARILARALNCIQGPTPEPCNQCPICQDILSGTALDVLEIDAASNRGIDEIRNLRENVRYTPAQGKFRVYIIDEIHMLTIHAFNAFLKTLEEPPAHVVFIGATTELEQIPRTVLSRVQRFNFRLVSRSEIANYLKLIAQQEGIEINGEALDILAARAYGSIRDGLGLLDQLSAYCEGTITAEEVRSALGVIGNEAYFKALDAIAESDPSAVFNLVTDLTETGADPTEFMRGFADYLRDLILVKSADKPSILEGLPAYQQKMAETAQKFNQLDLLRLMKSSYDAISDLKRSQTPLLGLELRLLQMQKLYDSAELSAILKQFAQSETFAPKSAQTDIFSAPRTEKTVSAEEDILPPKIPAEKSAVITEEVPEQPPEKLSLNTVPAEKLATPLEPQSAFERIKNSWSDICEALKKHNNHLGLFLYDAIPEKIKGTVLEISCEKKFNKEHLDDHKQMIQDAIKEAVNITLSIKVIATIPKPENNHLSKGRRELLEELKSSDPLVKDIVERFNAEPI
jgi:DNA polymerase-3 subunit gamma/tau